MIYFFSFDSFFLSLCHLINSKTTATGMLTPIIAPKMQISATVQDMIFAYTLTLTRPIRPMANKIKPKYIGLIV